ncbi:MAG: hypothetical protein WEF86_04445 [Gemmatimonadota bacterium]
MRRAVPCPRTMPATAAALLTAIVLCAMSGVQVHGQAVQDTAARVVPADSYDSERTRELVRQARARRALYDARISAYSATVVERLSVGLRAGLAERLVFRRETASRIDWTLDTVRVEVLGARDVAPPFSTAVGIPADLQSYMPSLAFDPVGSEMMLRLDSTDLRHPLAPGGEQYYRYEMGDSSVITLPDGRTVRLHELRIRARRPDPQLIVGSFWIDAASHGVVQVYFRQSRRYDPAVTIHDDDSDDDGDDDEDDGCGIACRVMLAVMPETSAELDHIAIEYGLWDLEWWMPRSIAAAGVMRVGRFAVPVHFERRYSDYDVAGNPLASISASADSTRSRPCRPQMSMSINVGGSTPDSAAMARRDSVTAVRRAERAAERLEREMAGDAVPGECDRTFIVTRAEADELLASELLPGSIYSAGEGVLDLSEVEAIAAGLRRIPSVFWQLGTPQLRIPSDLRYNRVEGASVAIGARMDLGRILADAELGIGTGDRRLRGELGVTRPGSALHARGAAYSRLAAMDSAGNPFSLGSSFNALFLGRDEHEYFRTAGAELIVRPGDARAPWFDVRLFAERQTAVEKHTDFSVSQMIDDDRTFRENFVADAVDQLGATVRLRTSGGVDPGAFRWATELELHGETGDYAFVRPALRLQSTIPLRRFALTTELAGGSSVGDAPAQRDWLLGGSSTLRGYPFAAARGEAFWRGRAELGYGVASIRIAAFGDVGYAGDRRDVFEARPLRSAGVGISVLDGLVRLDLARPLDGGRWRMHVHVDGMR